MSNKWDLRFLQLARLVSTWSKDGSTKVGSVIVDPKQRVVSIGFNGLPRGVPDTEEVLADRETKLKVIQHAESNCVLFAQRSVEGCTCYVYPMPPCAQCASRLIQAGIVRVVSVQPSDALMGRWGNDFELAEWMYGQAGVTLNLVGLETLGYGLAEVRALVDAVRLRLADQAGQENCDGEPYDTMMAAYDLLAQLKSLV